MALQIYKKFNFNGVQWKSGHFYRFNYAPWANDREPIVILLYRIKGTHPKTQNQWNLIQALNLNYVPRSQRKNFVVEWKKNLKKNNGNVYLTWQMVKNKYPTLEQSNCIRRYLCKPTRYISNAKYIEIDDIEKVVVKSFIKDFSKKLGLKLVKKYHTNKKLKKDDIITKALNFLYKGR